MESISKINDMGIRSHQFRGKYTHIKSTEVKVHIKLQFLQSNHILEKNENDNFIIFLKEIIFFTLNH